MVINLFVELHPKGRTIIACLILVSAVVFSIDYINLPQEMYHACRWPFTFISNKTGRVTLILASLTFITGLFSLLVLLLDKYQYLEAITIEIFQSVKSEVRVKLMDKYYRKFCFICDFLHHILRLIYAMQVVFTLLSISTTLYCLKLNLL